MYPYVQRQQMDLMAFDLNILQLDFLQVNTLLKGLEKIAASADIPMLVAGDFNSVPGSAAHTLLLKRGVDPNHPVSQPFSLFSCACACLH